MAAFVPMVPNVMICAPYHHHIYARSTRAFRQAVVAEIQVDIRHGDAPGVQKPFKDERVFERITIVISSV